LLTRIRIPVLNLPFREYEDSMKYWSDRIESDRVVQIKWHHFTFERLNSVIFNNNKQVKQVAVCKSVMYTEKYYQIAKSDDICVP